MRETETSSLVLFCLYIVYGNRKLTIIYVLLSPDLELGTECIQYEYNSKEELGSSEVLGVNV